MKLYYWLYVVPELGTRSFFLGSLSAPHSIFSPGSLTLIRSILHSLFAHCSNALRSTSGSLSEKGLNHSSLSINISILKFELNKSLTQAACVIQLYEAYPRAVCEVGVSLVTDPRLWHRDSAKNIRLLEKKISRKLKCKNFFKVDLIMVEISIYRNHNYLSNRLY
jgi:hypothetical protein